MNINTKSVISLGVVSAGFQLFYALIVDTPDMTSGFLPTLLLSALGFLPALLAFCLMERMGEDQPPIERLKRASGPIFSRAYLMLLAVFLLLSAALSVSELTAVSSYIALSAVSDHWLNLVTVLTVCLCSLCGIRSVAGSSRLRMLYLPFLLALVLIAQFQSLMPRWLLPVLGDGLPTLLREAVPLCGVQMQLVPLWFLCGSRRVMAGVHLRVVLYVALACLMYCMLTPTMPYAPNSWFFRLDTVLSNGRTSLSLQLPYMIILYTGLLTGGCYGLSMAATLLEECFPRVKQRWFVLNGGIFILALLYTGLVKQEQVRLLRIAAWPAILLPLLLIALCGRKRGVLAHE